MGESFVEPSYDHILFTVWAQAQTGQRRESEERWKFTALFFSLFFWSSKVILIKLAVEISSFWWSNSLIFLKNLKFCRHSNFVFLSSCAWTLVYSQDLMQKNIAPIHSVAIAFVKSCYGLLIHFPNHAEGDCFLVLFFWVCFFIAFELQL